MSDHEVIVYSSTGCPHCKQVKSFLTKWGILYEERNVSSSKEFFDELKARKIFGTPATLVNGKLALGFQEKKLKKLLNISETDVPPTVNLAIETSKEQEALEPGKKDNEVDFIFQEVNKGILEDVYDFVTIGGGPAGASAAVYAARGKLKTLVIDKAPKAGTLAITHKIANYPGIPDELTGMELLHRMFIQAKQFGVILVRSTALSVDFSQEIKEIYLPEGTIKAKSVFIAVGAKAPSNKIKGEEEFTGRGVSYCSTCDAAFYQDQVVVVVGDNEEAIQEAETLSKYCKLVKLLMPTNHLKGDVDLSALEEKSNVEIYKAYRLKEIQGEESVQKIIIVDNQKKEQEWPVDGVFLYLAGLKPGTEFLKDAIRRDTEGYIEVDEYLRTSVDGVFAGGDARKTPIKQAVLSAADGAVAAIGADQYVNKRSKLRPQYN